MGMEEVAGGKCFPAGWGMGAKMCDSCNSAVAMLFCRVDSAFLCISCDVKIHGLGNLRHERVWMCEVCEQAPASVTCKADAAALCVTCDRDIHSANPLARRHERFPVVPFYDTAESVVKSVAVASFLVPAGDETTTVTTDSLCKNNDTSSHTCLANAETIPPSWVLPNPTKKLAADAPEMKSSEYFFSESDQLLDFDYPISIHHSGTDSVVPVQPMELLQPTTQQLMNQSSENYFEIDFGSSKLNSYHNTNSFTAQSLSQSISSSSMDVGVVPDGSSMSDMSYSYGRSSNSSVDPGGPANAPPCRAADREARVLRYREKRKNRKFEKTIRYASRKAYAETRPRIKGRFAKRTDAEAEGERMFTTGSSAFRVDTAGYGVVPSF